MVGGAGHVETLRAAHSVNHSVDLAAGSALVKDGDALSNAFARVHFAGVWIGGYNKHAYNNMEGKVRRRGQGTSRQGTSRQGTSRQGTSRAEPLCAEPLCAEPLCAEPLCAEPLCVGRNAAKGTAMCLVNLWFPDSIVLKYFITKLYYQMSQNSILHVDKAEPPAKLEEVTRLMAQSNLYSKPDLIDHIIKKMEKHKEDFAKRRERERRKNRGLIGGKSKRVKSKRNKRSTKRRNARK